MSLHKSLIALFLCCAPFGVTAQSVNIFPVSTSKASAREDFYWGLRELREGMRSRSTTRLDRALAADSNLAVARIARARARLGMTSEWRRSEAERAVRDAAGATREEQLFVAAWKEYTVGRREIGDSLWNMLMQLVPDDPMIVQERPSMLLAKGLRTEALAAARQLVIRFPASPELYNQLAYTILAVERDTGAALSALEEIPKRAPQSAHAHSRLARSAASWGIWKYAAEHYRRAVELDSTFTYGYFGLADVAVGSGKIEDAQRMLRSAIRTEPSESERIRFERFLANLAILRQRPEDMVRTSIELAGRELSAGRSRIAATILVEAASVDAIVGNGRQTESLLGRARAIGDVDLTIYYTWAAQALSFSRRNDAASVMADSLEALARQTRNAYMGGPVLDMVRGTIALNAGNVDEAIQHLVRADTTFPMVRLLTGRAYKARGEAARARAEFENVQVMTRYQPYAAADAISRGLAERELARSSR